MERKLKRKHPGFLLRMELVEGKNLTVSKIAELLNTTRSNISNVINGSSAISPNMALRLETVFGGSAQHFMRMQSAYDLEVAKEEFLLNPPKISKYEYA